MSRALYRRERHTSRLPWLRKGGVATLAVGLLIAGSILAIVLARAYPSSALDRGQAVASVDGQDVTLLDLAAEARAQGRQYRSVDRAAYLDTVISRLLLARAAHLRHMDQSVTFPSDRSRSETQLLAEQMIHAISPVRNAGPSELQAYVATHSYAFDHRVEYVVDRLDWLQEAENISHDLDTLNSLRGALQRAKVHYEETQVVLNTDEMDAVLAQRLQASATGAPVLVQEQGRATAMKVLSARPAPLTGAAAVFQARSLLERNQRRSAVSDMIQTLRRQATVFYRSGYAPSRARVTGESR